MALNSYAKNKYQRRLFWRLSPVPERNFMRCFAFFVPCLPLIDKRFLARANPRSGFHGSKAFLLRHAMTAAMTASTVNTVDGPLSILRRQILIFSFPAGTRRSLLESASDSQERISSLTQPTFSHFFGCGKSHESPQPWLATQSKISPAKQGLNLFMLFRPNKRTLDFCNPRIR